MGALLLSVPVLTQADPAPTGYDLLFQAGEQILPGPNGGPSALQQLTQRLPHSEDLKNERLAVARNAPALVLLRQALQKSIEFPLVTDYQASFGNVGLKSRELARQLAQESDVRFGDGDYTGAMQSRLDVFELAVRFEHGPLINSLTGTAIASIGRTNFVKIASKLNATQCQSALARLQAIEANQATFAEVLTREQGQTQQMLVSSLPAIQKDSLTPEGRERAGLSEDAVAQVAALTPAQLQTDIEQVFAPIIANARLSYGSQAPLTPPTITNPLLEGLTSILTLPQTRFRFERSHAQDRLLLAALELRTSKLVLWDYPDRFTPLTDPFSPDSKPLIYKKTVDSYLLYSLGPDGKDDGGTGAQMYAVSLNTSEIDDNRNPENFGWPKKPVGPTSADRLPPDFKGDIVQTPF